MSSRYLQNTYLMKLEYEHLTNKNMSFYGSRKWCMGKGHHFLFVIRGGEGAEGKGILIKQAPCPP